MKKITLFALALGLSFNTFSQNIVWSDDFNDLDISDWTLIDADGDGYNWDVVQIVDLNDLPVGTPQLRSASYIGGLGGPGAINPDNWIITPAIDLTSASGTIAFNWQVKASDADYDAENYTVYVSTGNTITEFMASATLFNEPTLDGVNELTDRTLDISSFAGETEVYIAFRHFGVSDEFTMEIDNVEVNAETVLSIDDEELNTFSYTYNSTNDRLNLTSVNSSFESVQLFNITGQQVLDLKLSNTNESIDFSNYSNGVYLVKVNTNNSSKTLKIIKS
ncbi:T9SS type A sorting domain-containing protein [Winogradskyella sp. PC D3.3]